MPTAPVLPADTLTCDTMLLQHLQQSPAYDYQREFIERDYSIIDRILDYLYRLFSDSVSTATDKSLEPYWIIGAVVVIVAAAIYLYGHNVGLFRRESGDNLDYQVEDEDIYSINFDERISQAVAQRDWREASRLAYLKTLRSLADAGHVEWAAFKTPTQYTHEETSGEFRRMTAEFLRIRYGNFRAVEGTYAEMSRLCEILKARIDAETAAEMQEGGRP